MGTDKMYQISHPLIVLLLLYPCAVICYDGIERLKCESRIGAPSRPHSYARHHIHFIREQMKTRSTIQGETIDAYIVTAWDDHLNVVSVSDRDKRTQFISGFTGKFAHVVITKHSVALWTDEKYLNQADSELNCDWKIFKLNASPTLVEYIMHELPQHSNCAADPKTVPHKMWMEWETEFQLKYIRLVRLNENFVDNIWTDRPAESMAPIKVHPLKYAGEKWQTKIKALREQLQKDNCDAMVVTSLTEIAYLLNLRGEDFQYTPIFKAYLLITMTESFLYVNQQKTDVGINLHLNSHLQPCDIECVRIKDYDEIWTDLHKCSYVWRKILVPGHCVFDLGVSEAIYSSISKVVIIEKPSPVIFMRARKNPTELKGMERAHIIDGAAMCDALSLLERRFKNHETITEVSAANDIDRARYSIRSNRGLSLKTTVAFGPHSSIPHFETFNETNMIITDKEPIILDSGGQYNEGTTIVSRTIHFGEPTFEQKKLYTNVLRAIIRMSTLNFPESVSTAEVDVLARSSVWDSLLDNPKVTGHGVGSFLNVQESPIEISYTVPHKYPFKEGYFFSHEPGMYKQTMYGIRLSNVLEVYDTGKRQDESGPRFFGFRDVSLVPFHMKLIDRGQLSLQEIKWLNDYNARIRLTVGEELKSQYNMQTFYWMMDNTMHVKEYFTESEFRERTSQSNVIHVQQWICAVTAVITLFLAR